MIKEAYVSFETAKLLKEKGFDEPCHCFYKCSHGKITQEWSSVAANRSIYESKKSIEYINAYTHQMACAWLREKYGYHISILWNCGDRTGKETFIWGINNINNFEDKGHNGIGSNVYEETLEAALKYTLENLI